MNPKEVLKPVAMMVFYSGVSFESQSHYNSGLSNENVYIEYAPIINNKAGALCPLSDSVASVIARQMGMKITNQIGGYVTDNIIYSSFDGMKPTLAWYTKPKKRKLLYDAESIGIDHTIINTPGLLWLYKSHEVYVFAVKERPTKKTILYHAPFSNISNSGLVCLGAGTKVLNNQMFSFSSIVETTELAFFGTKFTHQSNAGIKGNLMTLHKKLNDTDDEFPLNVLKKSAYTLESLLKENNSALTQDLEDDENEEEDDYQDEE